MQKADLRKVKGVCLDIDETLSTRGKLTAEAFAALWALKKAGYFVVPITGRPAGWCDHVARFWPVDAVVGENGAFTFFMQKGVRRRLETPAGLSAKACKARLKRLHTSIQKAFPDARVASDQAYREFDLAIASCQDVRPWHKQRIERLITFCRHRRAHA